MKKLKIYLDTSVISHLDAPEVPEKEADTRRLWTDITMGKFEACISPVVAEELARCSEPKCFDRRVSMIANISLTPVFMDVTSSYHGTSSTS